MADSIPSTNICRKCKQEKPEDQFISKTKSSITRGRRTANCLDCRNRQASGTSKRTAEQAELSPIRRQGLPLLDLQLGTPIISQGPILLGTPLAMSTGADAPAPITSRPGPLVPSQEGVRLGAPIESPVSSPSIWPRHARGRYSRPSVQQSVIERRDFQLPDPDWMGDLSNCPLSDRDKELLEKFWTELENDRMERCTRCQETWFDMGLKDDICKRCIAKDKNKKEDEPWFFSAENQLDFGLIPVFLPELTKVEEMLIAPVHVFVNVMQRCRTRRRSGSHEGASKNDAAVLDKVDDTVRHWGTREEAADWAKAVEWWTGKCAHCVGRGWRGQQVAHNMRDCESGGRQQLRKELGEAIFQEGSRALGGCSDCAMPRDFCNAWMKGAGGTWQKRHGAKCQNGKLVYDTIIGLYYSKTLKFRNQLIESMMDDDVKDLDDEGVAAWLGTAVSAEDIEGSEILKQLKAWTDMVRESH
ncbi:hypothetical protein HIM_09598 [Hirsutella minnesotensis 3608]|uniref:DUF6570 domain-containing protein n=1 Tax=Hirsutella minnesotensis 3608 TaxID=1043627 RepID=A0A0F8A311_9HYPO|nr:hypothetical protein HIM_09598 [Hirsutella minnesotensis 3608]